MSNTNNNDIGNRIQQSVADALSSGDFSKLNSEIRSSVMSVLNDVGDSINKSISDAKMGKPIIPQNRPVSQGYNVYDVQRHTQERSALVRKPEKRVKFKDVGAFLGPFGIFWGTIFAITGIAIFGAVSYIPGVFAFALGAGIFGKSIDTVKWNKLANRYKKLCSEKLYIGVEALADATGTSQKKTIKNVKKILAKGFFPEGFIDEDNTTLMVSKDVYNQYIETKKNAVNRLAEENEARRQQEANKHDSEMRSVVAKGMEYIGRLHELNDRIPGVTISEKLSRLEGLLKEIFNRVSERPETVSYCGKLMDYYLPTMIKLVEAYEQYDKVSQPGEDIKSAKAEIENTLDIINQSFVELLNKLYQNSVWDVKSDAKVLQTMLKQEGLAADELAAGTAGAVSGVGAVSGAGAVSGSGSLKEVTDFGSDIVTATIPQSSVPQSEEGITRTEEGIMQSEEGYAQDEVEEDEEQWIPGVQRMTDADVEVLNR